MNRPLQSQGASGGAQLQHTRFCCMHAPSPLRVGRRRVPRGPLRAAGRAARAPARERAIKTPGVRSPIGHAPRRTPLAASDLRSRAHACSSRAPPPAPQIRPPASHALTTPAWRPAPLGRSSASRPRGHRSLARKLSPPPGRPAHPASTHYLQITHRPDARSRPRRVAAAPVAAARRINPAFPPAAAGAPLRDGRPLARRLQAGLRYVRPEGARRAAAAGPPAAPEA